MAQETSGSEVTSISPRRGPGAVGALGAGLRTATAQVETPRIITPSSTAWPPTGRVARGDRHAVGHPGGVDASGPASALIAASAGQSRLLRAARRRNRSTRPPVSTSFCLPV